jgi:TonB family protein
LNLKAFVLWAMLIAPSLAAQTTGAEVRKMPKPLYPEVLAKALKQGNVLLIGRIDTRGKVEDIHVVATSHEKFVEAAVAAVKTWEFRPATRDGKPVEIAANVGVRFRLDNDRKGDLPRPTLGDLSVYPADAAGNRAAPEGFPIRRTPDARFRVEAVLDVSPANEKRTMPVSVTAVSPKGRKVPLYEGSFTVAAKARDARIPFAARVGPDWEDGIWMLRFSVNRADAGGGQLWLAADPSRFDFAAALAKIK